MTVARICQHCGTRYRGECPNHPSAWTSRPPASQRGYGGSWPAISRAVIAEHVGQHGWTCPGWEVPPHPSQDLTVDHIVPVADGGTNDRANLRVLCRSCNTRRAVVESNDRRRGGGVVARRG